MKKLIYTLLVLAVITGTVPAQIPDRPTSGFLFNTFSSIRVIGEYAVATTEFGLLSLTHDSTRQQYDPADHLFLNTQPYTVKVFGTVAAVRTWADIVYFVDISNLPELTLLGEADLGFEFYDYALHGQSLFIAAGYDGTREYTLTDYDSPVFADSSLKGVHCIQAEIQEDHLLVLDDYNGLLRYDLTAGGLDSVPEFLFVPRRATQFVTVDSQVAFALANRSLLYVGEQLTAPPALTDSLTLLGVPESLIRVDSFLIAINQPLHQMEAIRLSAGTSIQTVFPEIMSGEFDGDSRTDVSGNYLLVPTYTGGIASFHVEELWFDPDPVEVYSRPGPVNDFLFHRGQLVTGGSSNPLEFYDVDAEGAVTLDTAFYGLNNVSAVAHSDSLVFAAYPDINTVKVLHVTDDSINVLTEFEINGLSVWDLRYCAEDPIDTLDALLALRLGNVEVYAISPELDILLADDASVSGRVLDAMIVDSFLVVTSNKFRLNTYKIFSEFRLILWSSVSVPDNLNHLILTDRTSANGEPILYGFADGGGVFEITIRKMMPPIVESHGNVGVSVLASDELNDTLYTIGETGLAAIDLESYHPTLVDQGGFAGHKLARDGNWLVGSAGTGVLLYELDRWIPPIASDDANESSDDELILRNYPNPFNPRTVIEYSVDRTSDVSLMVLNSLGQVVSTLHDGVQTAGIHRAEWNGTNESGRRVASGVYFYRLSTPDRVETRKMVLVK